ncbi:hypothetical protein ACLOAV_009925 [Pseudogymnoascus australis]
MTRMIFVNLCVSDIVAATAFYTAIGAKKNETYSNDSTSCMVFSEAIHVMIMLPDVFKGFTPKEKTIADPKKVSEVLLCLSVDKREDVDSILATAAEHGGRANPTTLPEMPNMYGRSFEDSDGHVWELMWMDESVAKEE